MKCKTYNATIFIAGDLSKIKDVCRRFCMAFPNCVTVTPTEFIYTGAAETGAIIGFINYPRFPRDAADIKFSATTLAHMLLENCHQRSCTIQFPSNTEYLQNPAFKPTAKP